MPDTTHECPAPGCDVRVPDDMLACRTHWYTVPKPMRDALWSAYNRHGAGSVPHRAAVDMCIRQLEKQAVS